MVPVESEEAGMKTLMQVATLVSALNRNADGLGRSIQDGDDAENGRDLEKVQLPSPQKHAAYSCTSTSFHRLLWSSKKHGGGQGEFLTDTRDKTLLCHHANRILQLQHYDSVLLEEHEVSCQITAFILPATPPEVL